MKKLNLIHAAGSKVIKFLVCVCSNSVMAMERLLIWQTYETENNIEYDFLV